MAVSPIHGLAEVGPDEVGPFEVGPVEVGPVEVGPAEVGPVEVGIAEVGPDEVGLAEAFCFQEHSPCCFVEYFHTVMASAGGWPC